MRLPKTIAALLASALASPLAIPPAIAAPTSPITGSVDWEAALAEAQQTKGGVVGPPPVVRDTFTSKAAPPPPPPPPHITTASTHVTAPGPVVNMAAPAPAAAPSSNSERGAAVFYEAKRYLGVPYVFGGATGSGLDCSGLVLLAFSRFGLYLPHSAMAQAERGTRIPESQARLGDLVVIPGQHIGFWSSPGMFLEAARPGTVVRIHSIWAGYYIVRLPGF